MSVWCTCVYACSDMRVGTDFCKCTFLCVCVHMEAQDRCQEPSSIILPLHSLRQDLSVKPRDPLVTGMGHLLSFPSEARIIVGLFIIPTWHLCGSWGSVLQSSCFWVMRMLSTLAIMPSPEMQVVGQQRGDSHLTKENCPSSVHLIKSNHIGCAVDLSSKWLHEDLRRYW